MTIENSERRVMASALCWHTHTHIISLFDQFGGKEGWFEGGLLAVCIMLRYNTLC